MNTHTVRSGISIHRVLLATNLSEESSRALQHALAVARHYGAGARPGRRVETNWSCLIMD